MLSDGHTPAMLVTQITGQKARIVLTSDLVPGVAWVHLAVTMGYDRYPELAVDEKRSLLSTALSESSWLFFVHDPNVAAGRVACDERGRFVVEAPQAELVRWSLD